MNGYKTYACVIVDDEPKAISLLKEMLQIVNPSLQVVSEYTSWNKALEGLRQDTFDLLFLDISMQGRNGMDLLRCMPDLEAEVIFVTAHSDYALDAFRLSASGYLLKPINEIELAVTLNKALERIDYKKASQNERYNTMNNKIGISGNHAISYVDISDIVHLEAFNSYTRVHTNKETIVSSYNLGRFKELLPAPPFFQVHRSFMVNLNYIKQYKPSGSVIMDNSTEIPISKNVREEFLSVFKIVAGHK